MSSQRYDRLIADLRSDFRPQREWGEGRGLLLVVGHFLVGIAGGAWLMGTIYHVPAALVVGFVLGGFGGLAHLAFLGRPERALKMMRHWRTSWISRGFWGLGLFLVGGVVYLPTVCLRGRRLGGSRTGRRILALAGMVVIIGYMGFGYTASKGMPFWNSPLHPALYIAYALRGGIATLLVVAAARDGGGERRAVAAVDRYYRDRRIVLRSRVAGGGIGRQRRSAAFGTRDPGRARRPLLWRNLDNRNDRAGIAVEHTDGRLRRDDGADRLGFGRRGLLHEAVHRQGQRYLPLVLPQQRHRA